MELVDPDRLAEDIGAFRRALIPDLILQLLRDFAGGELSMVHLATLYVLDGKRARTVRDLAELIGRSVSAASRMVDQLVKAGLVDRSEDAGDRRSKLLRLTDKGTALLRRFERRRAEAQLEVTAYLTSEEQALVERAMALLGEASRRHIYERDAAHDGD